MRPATIDTRLAETARARAVCLVCGDLDGYDQLGLELDDLLDQRNEAPHLPSASDGHSKPGLAY